MMWLNSFKHTFKKQPLYGIEIVFEFNGIEKVELFGYFDDESIRNTVIFLMEREMVNNKLDRRFNIYEKDPLLMDLSILLTEQDSIKEIRSIESWKRM